MIISVSTGAFYKRCFSEIVKIISQTDCKNIELCLNNTVAGLPLREIEKEIEKKNLTVTSIHAPFEFLWKPGENERSWIIKCVEYAKALGAETITTHSLVNDGDGFEERHKRNLAEFLGGGIAVCTENMPRHTPSSPVPDSFLCRNEELLEFLDASGVPVTFDTTHFASHTGTLTDGYRLFKKHIRNIHISDYSNGKEGTPTEFLCKEGTPTEFLCKEGTPTEFLCKEGTPTEFLCKEHMILGTGSLPLRDFVKLLRGDGYAHLLTVELDLDNAKRNPAADDKQAAEAINISLRLISEAVG
ncbi:MAG: sugar phosphate isomerase/epimerase [Defluviitaleaceae bacterium]|nr:sugar phosphate isomerase/epimerase [Defluviitaleaceae bacterium]